MGRPKERDTVKVFLGGWMQLEGQTRDAPQLPYDADADHAHLLPDPALIGLPQLPGGLNPMTL